MVKPRLLVTAQSFVKTPELCRELESRLSALYKIAYWSPECFDDDQELVAQLQGVSAWIVGREPVSRQILSQCPQLRYVSKYGVGLDNVDFRAAKEFSVKILHAPGVNAQAVAEHTVGLMLSLSRNIVLSATAMRGGNWLKNGGVSLSGKTVAIVGCGAVGSALLPLLKAFGCPLLVVDLLDKSELIAKYDGMQVTLADALKGADLLTLHVPLTEKTFQMIGRDELAAMKHSAFLINTSRGEVICQSQLADALEAKVIAGAALDVFESEPDVDKRLNSLDNFVGTAHIAGNSKEAKWAMGCAAISEIERVGTCQS